MRAIAERAARLSLADWRYLAIAMTELFLARVRHARLPIGGILQELREGPAAPPAACAKDIDLARLSWALAAAAARAPWRADCLLQAMAADRWLRRHRRRPEFFLGVTADRDDFGAHAWLRCDGVVVTGGNCGAFAVLIGSPAETNGGGGARPPDGAA